MITSEAILRQLKGLVDRYEQAERPSDSRLTSGGRVGLLASAEAAIQRVAPDYSPYRVRAQEILKDVFTGDDYKLECLIGIVEALRDDYGSGALTPVRDLIRAEVFEDFLDMAQHLLDSGYKDPAAVLVGGVLEGELRKLATRASIPMTGSDGRPSKTEFLNSSLMSRNVYNKLDQKSVTSWLDLRNKSAHGHYGEYSADQVGVMLMGVRDFISRMSAGAVKLDPHELT